MSDATAHRVADAAVERPARRYGPVGRALHWSMAVLVIGLIASGWWMVDLTYYSPWYTTLPWLHKAFGVVVFLVALGLLVWRAFAPPADHAGHVWWERLASRVAQTVMLVCVIAIPVTG